MHVSSRSGISLVATGVWVMAKCRTSSRRATSAMLAGRRCGFVRTHSITRFDNRSGTLGFSSCGEVCPITLATLAGARKKLGGDAADVQVVYVTVDPERDDAACMKKFLGSFDATFVGGVGSRAEIDVAQASYGITSARKDYPDGNYTIGHSSSIYLIDRAGRLRAVMPYGHSSDDFVHDLKILLRG